MMKHMLCVCAVMVPTLTYAATPASFDRAAVESFLLRNGYAGYTSVTGQTNAFDNSMARDMLKRHENAAGYPKVHDDGAGNPTLGYGHLVTGNTGMILSQLFGCDVNSADVVSGKAALTQPQMDTLLDYDMGKRVDKLRARQPDFNTYPPDVQAAMLDLEYRGDLRSQANRGGGPSVDELIRQGRVDEAITQIKSHPHYSNPTLPGVRKRLDETTAILERYWDSQNVDALWDRAIVVGQTVVPFPDPTGRAVTIELARRATTDAFAFVDEENLRRFQTGRFINTLPFQFTTPISTGGLTDLFIPANTDFVFRLFDTAVEDGDIIDVRVASAAQPNGVSLGTISLTNAGQTLTQFVRAGAVEVRIRAINEGTLSPNTGGVQVLSPIISGNPNQNYNLDAGSTGVLRVVAR